MPTEIGLEGGLVFVVDEEIDDVSNRLYQSQDKQLTASFTERGSGDRVDIFPSAVKFLRSTAQ